MSEHPNVARLRDAYAAFAALNDLFADDVLFHATGRNQVQGDYRGMALAVITDSVADRSATTNHAPMRMEFLPFKSPPWAVARGLTGTQRRDAPREGASGSCAA
jgi:hypothetical protein